MPSRKKSRLDIYNLPDFDHKDIDKLYSNVQEDKLDRTKLAKIPGFITDEELKCLNEKIEKSNKQGKKKSTKRIKSTKTRKSRKRRKSTKRRRN